MINLPRSTARTTTGHSSERSQPDPVLIVDDIAACATGPVRISRLFSEREGDDPSRVVSLDRRDGFDEYRLVAFGVVETEPVRDRSGD